MRYYRGKYRGARRQWLDLAESAAQDRGLEFFRDQKEEAFRIPGDRIGRVRASLHQKPTVKLIVDDEIRAIQGDYGELEDRILLVVLLIDNSDEFNPATDHFVPVRDSILKRGDHTTVRSDGKTQLTISVDKTPFKSRKNSWEWVFEK